MAQEVKSDTQAARASALGTRGVIAPPKGWNHDQPCTQGLSLDAPEGADAIGPGGGHLKDLENMVLGQDDRTLSTVTKGGFLRCEDVRLSLPGGMVIDGGAVQGHPLPGNDDREDAERSGQAAAEGNLSEVQQVSGDDRQERSRPVCKLGALRDE